jgi:hypothetical protein
MAGTSEVLKALKSPGDRTGKNDHIRFKLADSFKQISKVRSIPIRCPISIGS